MTKTAVMKNLVAVLFVLLSLNAFSQTPSFVPADGLVAWYPFDQNFQDESDVDGGLIRRRCDHNFNGVQRDSYGVNCGFGVRCIQN